jgi:hypothetical protein
VLEPNNDVYEEVVKPLLEKLKPNLELGFSSRPFPDSLPEKRARVNLDCE